MQHANRYGVRYRGKKDRKAPTRERYMCHLKKPMIRSLRDGDEPFTSEGMAKYFPSEDIFEGKFFNACAVITSAGSLKGSSLGKFIGNY